MKEILYLVLISGFFLSGCEQRSLEGEVKAIEPIGKDLIIDPVEPMPVFPGEEDSLSAYLIKNKQKSVQQFSVNGSVVVGFIVGIKGELKEIEVLQSLCSHCDKEAIRLVENMPNWIPAEENGKPVATRVMLPVRFNDSK